MRAFGLFSVVVLIASNGLAINFFTTSVAPAEKKIAFGGSEAQSAVVGPNLKSQCPNGRVIVTDDSIWPPSFDEGTPATGAARWENLSGRGSAPPGTVSSGASIFKPPLPVLEQGPTPASVKLRPPFWLMVGSDHHLITLPNGDLVYQRPAGTREKMTPSQQWASQTFRGTFGPGARSTNLTWVSTDCGITFEYAGEIDSFGPKHEDCANPQDGATGVSPPWDMGGTDNPNLIGDAAGRVFALIPCYGSNIDFSANQLTTLVDKTYVFTWDGKSKTPGKFKLRGSFQPGIWGAPAVALSPTKLAVGIGDTIRNGIKIGTSSSPDGELVFPADTVDPDDGSKWGWSPDPDTPLNYANEIGSGIHASSLLAHMPGRKGALLWAYNSVIGSANGFRVYRYDPALPMDKRYSVLETIVPTASNAAVIHLTAIDPGDHGPVLLYWTELTTSGTVKQASVKGIVILDENNRAPVQLTSAPFTLPTYFLGDYWTAGGFKTQQSADTTVYHYYPMWVQPPGTGTSASAHFRGVTVTRKHVTASQAKMFDVKCCDLAPILEAKVSKSDPVVTSLLAADPDLADPRLRVTVREVAEKPVRARSVPFRKTRVRPESVREHQQLRVKQKP